MEHFVVSARKYRPQNFEDVVGQKAITNTLLKAIQSNHLAQALLFTGPRGVGKTSCARILAKKINQEHNEMQDPNQDFAFNIFELDAASNNSVDDIRSLTDQVRIPPQTGKYKVYIIDEVHMLSQAAFNAFLKTLEEPPKHAIFILATTEKHKIIPTILSRCQIFDFKRITVNDIKEHLAAIAKKEGVNAADDALHIIAQKADGAMRDALSTYDRVVSYAGTNLTRIAVAENLNVLDYEVFFKQTAFLLEGNIPEAMVHFNQILSKGFDGQHFISGLASHFRDLLVCKNAATIPLLEVGEEAKSQYSTQSKETSYEFLMKAIDFANECDFNYKQSQNQRLLVELCLMKMASIQGKVNFEKKNNVAILKPEEISSAKATSIQYQASTKQEINLLPSPTKNPIDQVSEQEKNDSSSYTTSKNNNLEKSGADNFVSTSNTPSYQEESQPNQLATEPLATESIKNNAIKEIISSNIPASSGFSLSSLKKKKELIKQHQVEDETDILMEHEFSEEDLLKIWNTYATQLEKKGKQILSSILHNAQPRLSGLKITAEVVNDTTKNELQEHKAQLLQYLKKQLKNTTIELDVEVNSLIVIERDLTPLEKYKELVKANPLVKELQEKLDLEL